MITKINIDNFKSIKSLMLAPTSLNLFMGMGKSTVIQSLLLLRQSKKSRLKQLSLNGSMVEIGRGKDALYNFAETEKIHFNLGFAKGKDEKEDSLNVSYMYSAKSDVLNQTEYHVDSEIFNQPLFTTDFVFLNVSSNRI